MTTLSSICYHYLSREGDFKRIWGHPFGLFKEHIDFLKDEYEVVGSKDLLAENFVSGKKYMLLTFDDGLKDHIQMAGYLDRFGLKGIFAVPACILRGEPANPQIIHFGTAYYGVRRFYDFVVREIAVNFPQHAGLPVRKPAGLGLTELQQNIKKMFKRDLGPRDSRRILLNIYNSQLKKDFPNFMEMVHLNEGDVRKLVRNGHALAVHSDTHPVIKDIGGDEELMRKEIIEAGDVLSAAAGTAMDIFAYPFGAADEVLDDAVYFVNNGFKLVLTTYGKPGRLDFFDLGRYCSFSTDSVAVLSERLWHYKIEK